jgi:hydrogenase-4 membrane subunit HyfE
MNIYYISIACALTFFIIKILENKFIMKEKNIQSKKYLKDSIIIFIIIILIYNIYFNLIKKNSELNTSPSVFLNTPDF